MQRHLVALARLRNCLNEFPLIHSRDADSIQKRPMLSNGTWPSFASTD
jgi:hypothetical protein